MTDINPLDWQSLLNEAIGLSQQVLDNYQPQLNVEEIGTVTYVGRGIARARGLLNVQSEELVEFRDHRLGIAYSLEPDEIGIILLDDREGLQVGCQVWRTGRFLDTPVGTQLLGRVIDATGCPWDNLGAISTLERLPVARDAPGIMQRAPVTVPLQTGIKVIDALIPIGRGQRELIIGDRATGKTAIAIDTIINQKDQDVICIYCAIGQGSSAVAKLVAQLRQREALEYSIVVVAQSVATPGLQYITPYAATTMAEYFRSQGKDVLIVYDDLMQHARAYRQLSLLLRFPPGREAFPGDIFDLHSRLLERAAHLRPEFGGGSLTALPIVETEEQNISAYIPINLVSITDGQIYLTSSLFDRGILPAIDVSRSVSRLGRQAQLPAYRQVAGDLRLSYFQFEELKKFSHLGSSLGAAAQKNMRRGERIEELLKQIPAQPIAVAEQITILLALTQGIFDFVAIDRVVRLETAIRQAVREQFQDVCHQIEVGETLSSSDRPQSIDESAESMFPSSSLHQVLINLAQEVKDNLI